MEDGRRIAEKFSTAYSIPIPRESSALFWPKFSTDFSQKGIETLASGLLDFEQPLNADVWQTEPVNSLPAGTVLLQYFNCRMRL
jgi:hypothetical protein